MRINGELTRVTDVPVIKPEDMVKIAKEVMQERTWKHFDETNEADFAYSIPNLGRFRVNGYRQRSTIGMVFRLVRSHARSFGELNLPESVRRLASEQRGLILVTGPTGCGKTTTLAAMVDHINRTRECHIVTIEDPIEVLHQDELSAVSQREVGFDTASFLVALRAALREDPDVILVGEMRDTETVETALSAAETGHLVFGTLHTYDAPQAIDRIIDVFPADKKDLIRIQLAGSLGAVVAQRLVSRVGGGRVGAFEVLLANNASRALIREGKTYQLRNVITTNQREGMQTLETSLIALINAGTITYDAALEVSMYPKDIARAMA